MKKIILLLVLPFIVYFLFICYFSYGIFFKNKEIDYYPGKYEWKCKTDIECFEEEQACLASGACVRQR